MKEKLQNIPAFIKKIPQAAGALIISSTLLTEPVAANNQLQPATTIAPFSEENNPEVTRTRLEAFQEQISPQQQQILTTIQKHPNIISSLIGLSPQQVSEDISLYFPMYKAAEEKYGVAWQLLWIIHMKESTVSRHPNPEASGYRGAMQLSNEHMRNWEIASAPSGYEFLDELPQRYSKKSGKNTTDWEEILRAAAFIHTKARDLYPNLELQEAMLRVVRNNYSASGQTRIVLYQQLKSVFEQS